MKRGERGSEEIHHRSAAVGAMTKTFIKNARGVAW